MIYKKENSSLFNLKNCAIIFIVLLLLGCGGGITIKDGGSEIEHHVWGPLYNAFMEQTGYGMYTYVLFKYEQKDSTEEGKEITERYRVILDAIIGYVDTLGDTSIYSPQETNVFYIPFKEPYHRDTSLLDRYNYNLSRKYVAALSKYFKNKRDISRRLRRNPGPFLVSLVKPLGSHSDKKEHLLFADLSKQNKNSIREAVEIYKVRLEEKPVDKVERLKSTRLKLVDVLQDSQDCLVLIKAEIKKIRELITG